MSIIPTIRCRRIQTSIAFDTNVLDFQCVEYGGDDDPSCSALMRGNTLRFVQGFGINPS